MNRCRGRAAAAGGSGGGVGTRGPGETKIETDRRRIRERMSKLRREIKDMKKIRDTQRGRRLASDVPSIAIVGYTNAGKSSLLNALTGAGVLVENALFATLEPTTRRGEFDDGRPFVLTDTVGFVRHLPTQLVEAFRSTLEEVVDADLLVHVVDGSDANPLAQINAVRQVVSDVHRRPRRASRRRSCWWSTRSTPPAIWRWPSCAGRCPMRCSSRRTPATAWTDCSSGWPR